MTRISVCEILRPLADRAVSRYECCDTTFTLHSEGIRARAAVDRATVRMRDLERQLDAFDNASAVSKLNRSGGVTNMHVAAIVERALEYRKRTDARFDISHGAYSTDLKAYLSEERDSPPLQSSMAESDAETDTAVDSHPTVDITRQTEISVDGDTVTTDCALDLNGLAKGYVVDQTAEAIRGIARKGFVDGGGDISSPTGAVAVESPFGDDEPLTVLETSWNVASSAGYRRRRDGVDHLYNPRTGFTGSRHDGVTVVAERDCMEADALATTLATTPLDHAIALVESWPGSEALVVHGGVYNRSSGFEDHEAE